MPDITIVEMGPRDGLQNQSRLIETKDKIKLVNLLSDAGFSRIETSSFVSPKWVPQLADASAVFSGIARRRGTRYTALTPNIRGFEAARLAAVDEIAVFGAASESFSQKNINCSIAESLTRFTPVLDAAHADGIPVRGYVSCVTDCPFEGRIDPAAVAQVTKKLLDMGCFEVSLGDTIGHGTPQTVTAMLKAVLQVARPTQLAAHFHDTKSRALANVETALGHGITVFDASVAGLGGCPYAPGASGNVATEALVDLMISKKLSTGIDPNALTKAVEFACKLKEPP